MLNKVFGLLLFTLASAVQGNNILEFQGNAYDPETRQLIYIEKHRVLLNQEGRYLSSTVKYQTPNGALFAEKQVDYSGSSIAPSFTFIDFRMDSRVSVVRGDQSIYLNSENGARETTRKVAVDVSKPVVVDAGFDRLIYENWQRLLESKDLSFAFLAITRAQLVNLDVIEKARTKDTVVYRITPSNFFFRLLVDPIELTYDLKNKQLLRFEGLTNIAKSENGKVKDDNYVAVINYRYAQ